MNNGVVLDPRTKWFKSRNVNSSVQECDSNMYFLCALYLEDCQGLLIYDYEDVIWFVSKAGYTKDKMQQCPGPLDSYNLNWM